MLYARPRETHYTPLVTNIRDLRHGIRATFHENQKSYRVDGSSKTRGPHKISPVPRSPEPSSSDLEPATYKRNSLRLIFPPNPIGSTPILLFVHRIRPSVNFLKSIPGIDTVARILPSFVNTTRAKFTRIARKEPVAMENYESVNKDMPVFS